jgi:hypothetical protein
MIYMEMCNWQVALQDSRFANRRDLDSMVLFQGSFAQCGEVVAGTADRLLLVNTSNNFGSGKAEGFCLLGCCYEAGQPGFVTC